MTKCIEDNLELVRVSVPAEFPIRSKIPLLHHPTPDEFFMVLVARHIKPCLDGIPTLIEFGILAEFLFHRIKLVLLLNEWLVITNLHLMLLLRDNCLS